MPMSEDRLSGVLALVAIALALAFGSVSAQGLMDVVTGAIVDTVNDSMGVDPPGEVRRLQLDAARVALRGTDDDWERFIESARGALGTEFEPLIHRTRSAANTPQSTVEMALGRQFDYGRSRYEVSAYSWGRFDPSGDLLPFVMATSVDGQRLDYAAVVDPEDFSVVHRLPGLMGAAGLFERNPPPGTAFDINGDGIDEILWLGASWRPRPQPDTYHQWISVLAWRTPENEHHLEIDRSGAVLHGDASYVSLDLADFDISGYSSGGDPVSHWLRWPQLVGAEIVPGDGRDRLLLHLYQWPYAPDKPYEWEVAMPINFFARIAQVNWGNARHVWTREVFMRGDDLVVESIAEYAPVVETTSPFPIVAHPRRQWIDIVGTGFTPSSRVTFLQLDERFDIPLERAEFVSSTRLRVFAGLFPSEREWAVVVTNEGDIDSEPLPLLLIDP